MQREDIRLKVNKEPTFVFTLHTASISTWFKHDIWPRLQQWYALCIARYYSVISFRFADNIVKKQTFLCQHRYNSFFFVLFPSHDLHTYEYDCPYHIINLSIMCLMRYALPFTHISHFQAPLAALYLMQVDVEILLRIFSSSSVL